MIPTKYLEVKIHTQNKDSHGLYDYESQTQTCDKVNIYKQGCIIKIGDKYETVLPQQLPQKVQQKDFQFVASVTFDEVVQEFYMAFALPEYQLSNQEERYLIPRYQHQSTNYNLQVGDLFKLGKIEFHVIEKQSQDLQVEHCKSYFSKHVHLEASSDENQLYNCKYCLSETMQSAENPILYNICKCVGQSSYVHLSCLSQWVDQNIEKQHTFFGAQLSWTKAFECQVCKDQLPMRVTFMGKVYDLFDFERPQIPYIMVEQLNKEKGNSCQILLMHGWNPDPIKLGRGQNCDIRLNEITVSRQHATIQIDNDGYWLKDNNSKFGSLVLMQESVTPAEIKIPIAQDQCGFQVGRQLVLINTRQARLGQTQQTHSGYIGSPMVYQKSPRLQQKLTKIPQISNQFEEDEPQMDDDSENESSKKVATEVK